MRDRLVSCEWKPPGGVVPAALVAVEWSLQHRSAVTRIVNPEWVLDYSFTPDGSCRVGNPRRPWRQRLSGMAHLYPPGCIYWEDTRQVEGLRHCAWFWFRGGEEAGLKDLLDDRTGYAEFADPDGKLGELFQGAARQACPRGEQGFWEAQAYLSRMIFLLHEAQSVGGGQYVIGGGTPSSESQFVLAVQQYFAAHLSQKVTLADVAKHVHVSVSSLAHRYPRQAGESPMQTLARMRIDQTKILLRRGVPLKAIAEQTGYSDAFHLSKAFKRLEGMPPREFLKRTGQLHELYRET